MATTHTFPKRKVWHSALREASPLAIILLDRPRDSKFADRLPYCRFQVEGDETEYELQVESREVFAILEGLPIGQPLLIAATGAREAAHVEVVGRHAELTDRGNGRTPAATPREQHHQDAARIAARAENNSAEDPSLARDLFHALEAAHGVVEAFAERYGREPSDSELRVAASIVIEHWKSARPMKGGAR